MARSRRNPYTVLALSVTATALALDVPLRKVRRALDTGELDCFDAGNGRVRILIDDIARWCRAQPKPKRRKKS